MNQDRIGFPNPVARRTETKTSWLTESNAFAKSVYMTSTCVPFLIDPNM